MKRLYGLIGHPLEHSFSAAYFQQKFYSEKIEDAEYRLFSLQSLKNLRNWIAQTPNLCGFNVTIPYKREILQYVDYQDVTTKSVGAANVVKIIRNSENVSLIAFNTDVIGFERSLPADVFAKHPKALLLGTGGAAAAVAHVLQKKHCQTTFVSRTKRANLLTYSELTPEIVEEHTLIINATPCGMFPQIGEAPALPYAALTAEHFLYDLIYNPTETEFLKMGKERGATTMNGEKMLHLQAEASWEIWQR